MSIPFRLTEIIPIILFQQDSWYINPNNRRGINQVITCATKIHIVNCNPLNTNYYMQWSRTRSKIRKGERLTKYSTHPVRECTSKSVMFIASSGPLEVPSWPKGVPSPPVGLLQHYIVVVPNVIIKWLDKTENNRKLIHTPQRHRCGYKACNYPYPVTYKDTIDTKSKFWLRVP